MGSNRSATSQEVLACARAATPGRDRLLILMLSTTGLRITEILSLKVQNCFNEMGHLRPAFFVPRLKAGTGPKSRLIPSCKVVQEDLKAVYWSLPERGPHCFIFRSPGPGNYPITRRHALRIVKNCASKAGCSSEIACHSFRRWFAKELYERTEKDINLVRIALGHRSPASTVYYLTSDSSALRIAWNSVLVSTFGAPLCDAPNCKAPLEDPASVHLAAAAAQAKTDSPVSAGSVVSNILGRFDPSKRRRRASTAR